MPKPSGSGPATAVPTLAPGALEMALGDTAPVAPAADRGAMAATELNDFGFDLLRRLDPSSNLVASPASIALALGMVRPGARGATAAEMDQVLHSFGATGQESEIRALLASLGSQTFYLDTNGVPTASPDPKVGPAVELDVSNEAFAQKGYDFERAYLNALSSSFNAGVGLLDYKGNPEAARLTINKWAADRTKGRIPSILEQGDVDTLTRLVLVNAIYLKAAWAEEFDPTNTTDRAFTCADGSLKQVPTMAIESHYGYAAGPGYKAVDLPYSMNGLAMTVVVPDDMASFVKGLSAAQFKSVVSSESEHIVDFWLPKFSIESRVELSSLLSAMGMKLAVNPDKADFSGITTEEPLYISKVIHQANIDVVEQGTTAAAVTAVVMTAGAAPAQLERVQLHVDKPFLYFIRDTGSGAVLFMGRVNDPLAK
jgi:serpin B